jgi:hypothetical protein
MRSIVALLAIISCFVGVNLQSTNSTSGNPDFAANANLFLQLLSTFESTSNAILNTVQAVLNDLISGTTGSLNNSSNTVKDIILAAGNQTVTLLLELIELLNASPQQSYPLIRPPYPTFT